MEYDLLQWYPDGMVLFQVVKIQTQVVDNNKAGNGNIDIQKEWNQLQYSFDKN